MEKDFRIIYKKKPRTVNLCPYCRAVVGAVIMFPFIVLYRLFPHKKKNYTHQEIMKRSQRNSKIVRIIAAGGMAVLGVWSITTENYFLAVFHFGLVVFNLFSVQILTWIAKRIPQRKYKIQQYKEPKQPSKIVKIISEKHNLVCPPIFFVDTTDKENFT